MSTNKLSRPPYAHNWVRNLDPDKGKTTKNLVNLARGFPTKVYKAAEPIIHDRIMFGLDRETALNAAATTGRANSREIVSEYVRAFLDFDEMRQYSHRTAFDDMVEPFRVGKGISVPVKPIINIVENGKIRPIFSVGWASFPLTNWQLRMLATVFEDAVFSLRDFRDSEGEFVCFPKNGKDEDAEREPLVWHRGDYETFSKPELTGYLEMYLDALEAAKEILRNDAPKPKEQKPHPDINPDQGDFFLDDPS